MIAAVRWCPPRPCDGRRTTAPVSSASGELGDRFANLQEFLLQLADVCGVRMHELPTKMALPEVEQKLIRRSLVDGLGRRDGVELGECRRGLLPEKGLAKRAVVLAVEMIRGQILQGAEELRKREA